MDEHASEHRQGQDYPVLDHASRPRTAKPNLIARGHPLALGMATSIVLSEAGRTIEEAGLHQVSPAPISRPSPIPSRGAPLEASSIVRCVTEPLLHAPETSPRDTMERSNPAISREHVRGHRGTAHSSLLMIWQSMLSSARHPADLRKSRTARQGTRHASARMAPCMASVSTRLATRIDSITRSIPRGSIKTSPADRATSSRPMPCAAAR
jgi:hypothetical protein